MKLGWQDQVAVPVRNQRSKSSDTLLGKDPISINFSTTSPYQYTFHIYTNPLIIILVTSKNGMCLNPHTIFYAIIMKNLHLIVSNWQSIEPVYPSTELALFLFYF